MDTLRTEASIIAFIQGKPLVLPMKSSGVFLLMLFFSLTWGRAQDGHLRWEDAQEMAEATQRPILLVFQGSDWCAPCIKLDRRVWSTPVFKEHAKDRYILVKADFPRKKKNQLPAQLRQRNVQLAEAYNPRGIFPLVLLLDHGGRILGETGYLNIGPTEYVAHLNAMME
ncbi:thioredoxin family protein [Maribacter sp. 2307ULW6-5]|uniref:thioredoxin family protein n=1 Tax=Maribacter sp. 2307ULW6-5 TaxID=3386275 RepID=UPI0039BC25A1